MADKVTFHVMGEPLLHPGAFGILDHARSVGLPVGLTTNGALLNERIVKELAVRDLHQIDISLQSPDADSFAVTRGTKMDFEKYRAGLLDLVQACASRPEPPIFKVRIMTTRFAGKMKEQLGIPNFLGTSEDLQRTVVEWAELIYQRLGMDETAVNGLKSKVKAIKVHAWNVIEIAPKVFIETYVLTDWGNAFAGDNLIEANHGYCFGMRDHFAILYSGDVVLCCVDFDGETTMGNLKDSSLAEILSGSELEEIMKGFRTTRLVHPYCKKCLGSNSRIGSWTKPALSVLGLHILKPFFYRSYKFYD
ncbi:radical SAM/SPASM domain-containing protein [Thermodesulfobacteriota bacterium]